MNTFIIVLNKVHCNLLKAKCINLLAAVPPALTAIAASHKPTLVTIFMCAWLVVCAKTLCSKCILHDSA